MMLQQPPAPPIPPPPFDPNLIFQGEAPIHPLVFIVALIAIAAILYPLVKAFARRLEGKTTDPALQAEVEQLQARLSEVDTLQHRIAELEERVDFTERLLAQTQPQGRLGTSGEGSGR
jgi:Tfp pilus assembly protein PilO